MACRGSRGLEQLVDDPAVRGRLAGEQMLGDTFVRVRLFGEQLCGAAVPLRALDAGEVCVETAADDWVNERQRSARLEDPGGGQQLCRLAGPDRLETCELRSLEEVALFEDRQCRGEPARRL